MPEIPPLDLFDILSLIGIVATFGTAIAFAIIFHKE